MKYFVIFLVLTSFLGITFAEETPQQPEPTPSCPKGTILKNNACIGGEPICGEGTTYLDGICVVDEPVWNTNSSGKWANPHQEIILPPIKQFKFGVPSDEIQCKDNLVLIPKYDGSPACVSMKTKQKLIERGWTPDGSVCLGGPGTEFDENCVKKKNHSESKSSLSTQFEEIRSNIKKTQYSICDIQLEENKIIIHLNWIFEGSPQEEKIISKIPSNVDYQIVYHKGYSDYFINAITAQECDSLDITKSLMEKYDAVVEGTIKWCIGHKTHPVRYQCDIQVDQYIEFDGERTGKLAILSDRYPLISGKQNAFFGLNYDADKNYYELVETSIVANYNDFIETGRPLENEN